MTKKHLGEGHHGGGPEVGYGEPDDGQDYVDRSHLDFDPADGLLSGTALPPHHGGWLHTEEAPPDEPAQTEYGASTEYGAQTDYGAEAE